jgi:hypothetical protein
LSRQQASIHGESTIRALLYAGPDYWAGHTYEDTRCTARRVDICCLVVVKTGRRSAEWRTEAPCLSAVPAASLPACYPETMERFHEGDRVRLRNAVGVVRAGSVGTIRLVFRYTDDAYDVQFDRHTEPLLIYAHNLERVPAPPTSPIAPGPHS